MSGGRVAADVLKGLIVRIEALEEDKAAIAADIKEVFAEAKGQGFNTKQMRNMIKLRKMEAAERDESEHLRVLYKGALGLIPADEVPPASPRPDRLELAASAPSGKGRRKTPPKTSGGETVN